MNSYMHRAARIAEQLNLADQGKIYALLAIAEAIFYAGTPQGRMLGARQSAKEESDGPG